jgi:hypothetical protein
MLLRPRPARSARAWGLGQNGPFPSWSAAFPRAGVPGSGVSESGSRELFMKSAFFSTRMQLVTFDRGKKTATTRSQPYFVSTLHMQPVSC